MDNLSEILLVKSLDPLFAIIISKLNLESRFLLKKCKALLICVSKYFCSLYTGIVKFIFMSIKNFTYSVLDQFFQNNISDNVIKSISKSEKITIFDIGSFKGNFSQSVYNKLKKINNNNNIDFHLFDPISKSRKYAQNLKFKNIYYNNIAIHNYNGETKFNLNNFFEPSGSSIQSINKNDKLWVSSRKLFLKLLNLKNNIGNFEEIVVKCKTIDNYVFKNNIDDIHILKIDTEGNEFHVLEGAINTLKKNKVKIIYLEILEYKSIFDIKKDRILNYLKNFGFECINEKNLKLSSMLSNIKVQDLVFYNKNLKQD